MNKYLLLAMFLCTLYFCCYGEWYDLKIIFYNWMFLVYKDIIDFLKYYFVSNKLLLLWILSLHNLIDFSMQTIINQIICE